MMDYTATEPVWWVSYGGRVNDGKLEAGQSLSTGAEFFEAFTDKDAWNARLKVIFEDPREARRTGAPVEPYARLAWARWKMEVSGAFLPDGTMIYTDRESQAQTGSIVNSFTLGLVSGVVDYKAASGWVEIGQTEALAIGQVIATHVQRCFTAEHNVSADLDAMSDLSGVDVVKLFEQAYEALA